MDFVMENLPIILCAAVGIVLLVVEMFMPGFGLPGIAGSVLLLATIVLTWMQHGPYAGLGATLVVVALGGLAVTLSLRSASRGRLSRSPLVLKDDMAGAARLAAEQLEQFLGKQGTASTVPEEAAACLPLLRAQTALIRPQVILLLGATALTSVLNPQARITSSRGRWTERKGVWILPTFHPAALLRDPAKKRDAWVDLQLVRDKLAELEEKP